MSAALPSVTRILEAAGLGPDFSRVPADVLEAARARGTLVHRLIEAHHYGYLDQAEITPQAAPYMSAYLTFVAESGHEPIASEFRVEHAAWRYCGHPDRVGWLCGARVIADWKCTDTLALPPVARQLAGYQLAYNAQHPTEPVSTTVAVQLRSDGTYRLHELDASAAEPVFLAAVTVWWARAEDQA